MAVAATLQEILLAPDTRPMVVTDCNMLIEQEIAEKSGVSGTAVKLAYKTVNTFRPGHVRHMVDSLLPQLVDKLEPYWAGYRTSGGAEFGDYLPRRCSRSPTRARRPPGGPRSSRRTAPCAAARSSTSGPRSRTSATWC